MKYLNEYKERIEHNVDVIGSWMQKNIAMVEAGLRNGEYYYDDKKAEFAINFIESFCHHYEGRTDLVKLEPWQKYFVACMFGLVDFDGTRHFREFVLIVARKQGKSLFAAAIQVFVLFCDNEPGMQIYNLAPKLKQAKIIFQGSFNMIDQVQILSKRVKKRRDDVYYPKTKGVMAPLAFNGKKSDGFNPHFTTFDEFAAWEGEQGLKMAEVMLSAVGARKQPIFLYTSTANYVDNGLYDEMMARSTAVLQGTSSENRLLPFVYAIDDEGKWDDPEELKKAMPNLGVSVTEKFLQDEINKAHDSAIHKTEFLTKYCNIKQNSVTSWLSKADIMAMSGDALKLEDFSHMYGMGGVDLSQTTDLTAASILLRVDGEDYIFTHFWLPANRIKEAEQRDMIPYSRFIELGYLSPSGENYVQYSDVTKWFIDIRKKYKIHCLVVGYDRYSAQYFVDEMDKNGFVTDDVIQGTNLTPVIYEFEGLVKDKVVHTGSNGLLQTHFSSCAIQKVAEDNRVRMRKIEERKHIDGAASVIDAYTVRQKWYDKYKYRLENKTKKRGD